MITGILSYTYYCIYDSGVKNVEPTTVSAPTTPTASKLSPGNIFKNFFKCVFANNGNGSDL